MTGKTTPLPSPQRGVAPSTVIPAGRFRQWPTRGGLKRWQEALFAAGKFFAARISDLHTLRAYVRRVRRFVAWCKVEGLELRHVSPE